MNEHLSRRLPEVIITRLIESDDVVIQIEQFEDGQLQETSESEGPVIQPVISQPPAPLDIVAWGEANPFGQAASERTAA